MSDDACIFCRIARGEAPAHVVYESDHAIAFFDVTPANPYHTLVVPKRHVVDLIEATPGDVHHVMAAVKAVIDLFRDRLGLDNLEISSHAGAAAQQSVFHLHVHVVPRHEGDGQDTDWTHHPELQSQFDALLARLR